LTVRATPARESAFSEGAVRTTPERCSAAIRTKRFPAMSKDISYHQNARKGLKRGVDALANVVRVTLGPRGRNVALEKSWGAPTITKDGVTVAKQIEFEGKVENIGAQMVKEVATKTNDETGDGTTTATVLAQSIYGTGLGLVEAGIPSMDIKRGIDRA